MFGLAQYNYSTSTARGVLMAKREEVLFRALNKRQPDSGWHQLCCKAGETEPPRFPNGHGEGVEDGRQCSQ